MTVTVTTDKKTDDDLAELEATEDPAEEAAAIEDESDEKTETDEQGDEGAEAETEGTARGWRRGVLVGAMITAFVAALALSGFLGWQLWQTERLAQAGKQAQEAAVAYAQVLTSIDSNKVDENFNQVLAGATGEFKDMYSQSSMQLRQLLIDNKASARGVVLQSAVQSASEDKAVVLLFVDQSVSNTTVPDPRIDRSRIKMTMEKVDGQWRTSKVELV
jgi:Mce-associated membrane protein